MKEPTDEIAKWVDMYAEKLLYRAQYLLSDNIEAEDIVQEVFLTALSSYENFQHKSNPLTWLKGILQHKIADFYRKKYKSQYTNFDSFFDEEGNWKEQNLNEWENDEETLGNLLDNSEFSIALQNCLENLPPKWSILVKMCYLEDKNFSEICQVMNISQTNYWKMLQRSRLQLKECLEINWFKA